MAVITPVIMAGGTGTRLWPLSRRGTPKQFQKLLSAQTMLAETVARLGGIDGVEMADPIVVCGQAHGDLVKSNFAEAGIALGQLVLEPMGRNTAPVAVIAAQLVAERDPDSLILLLPADHHIEDPKAFGEAVRHAAQTATEGYLTTFGIAPDRPDTGYGYICRGDALGEFACEISRFVEKPDRKTAEEYLADGRFTWNAGIFMFSARALLAEAETHAGEILSASARALDKAVRDGTTVELQADTFGAVPEDSIDYAIMERTRKAAVVGPVRMGWSDIGSWRAVRDLRQTRQELPDGQQVIVKDCDGTMVHTDGPMVAAVGLENVVIVATDDAVLVVDADRAQDVKAIVEELKKTGRNDLL